MQETIVDTQDIFDGRVVHLLLHKVRLPDGEYSKREVVEHPGAVAIVALDDQQNVLMVRQFRLPAGKILYEIPAGTLEDDEAPEVCASREMREETGYKPANLESLGGFYTAPGYTTEFIHLFYATGLSEARLEQDVDEFIELERMPFSKALEMIEQGEIVDGKTILGLLKVARRLKLD
jgi:ADP-ribose pyrophosphatase